MNYRHDIDGLRAVAVLSVLIYHFGATVLPGGFSGVDIFFVISGYLITKNIRSELNNGTFSLTEFWARRIKRIGPALAVMIVLALMAGFVFLMPGDFVTLASQSIFAVIGANNIYLWQTTDYFAQVAELTPLVHTWSLGVEEQFYLLWPIILAAAWRLGGTRSTMTAIGLLAGVSLYLSVVFTGRDPIGSFYLLHTRAWELALGGAVAFAPAPRSTTMSLVASVFGLVAVAAAFLLITPDNSFPGVVALVPCAGAALLIWGGVQRNAVAIGLSLPPLVAIGRISYSLYLYHWPVLTFYRHYNNSLPPSSALEWTGLAAVSFLLAYLSWRFVEERFRRRIGYRPAVSVGVAAFAVGAAAVAMIGSAGAMWRIPERMRGIGNLEVMWSWPCPRRLDLGSDYAGIGEVCNFGAAPDVAEQQVLLWGESHAEHFAPLLEAAIGDRPISVTLIRNCAANVGEPYFFTRVGIASYTEGCTISRELIVRYLREHPEIKTVVAAAYWTSKLNALHEANTQPGDRAYGLDLTKAGLAFTREKLADRRFVVIAEVPQFTGLAPAVCNEPGVILLRSPCPRNVAGMSRADYQAKEEPFLSRIRDLASINVELVEPGSGMCSEETCTTTVNGEFIYRDNDHIRRNLLPATRSALATMTGLDALVTSIEATP